MGVLGFSHITFSVCTAVAEGFPVSSFLSFRDVPNAIQKRKFLGQTSVFHDIFLLGSLRQIELVVYESSTGVCKECRPILRALEDYNSGRRASLQLSVSAIQISTLRVLGLKEFGKKMILSGLLGQGGLQILQGASSRSVVGEQHGFAGIALYLRRESAPLIKKQLMREGFSVSANFLLDIGKNQFDIFFARKEELTFELLFRTN